jgi:hypothetical protein
MKDVTSTSFGLLIAFLLPGLAGLYSVSFWSPAVRRLFQTFLTLQSNVGLSILVLLAALTVGLLITVVRWWIFERGLSRKYTLAPSEFAKLDTDSKLSSFRAAVDENYRYHQFWGGMFVVIPSLFIGALKESWAALTICDIGLSLAALLVMEVITGIAAHVAYRNYGTRAKHILSGGK